MIDRKAERESQLNLQRIFLVECALRNKTHEQIDEMVYKIESIRRDVEYTKPQIYEDVK